ncbi:MAG: hypothetical protein PHQ54_03540, partial [Candidatus Omnitrophica bacterium]|nr:hypothetical protein [Candidatus Omnitrophota bacterium]
KVLKYIIENYSNLSKKDIQDINQRIASTPGKEWKKGFNVTFDAKIDDELGNTTQMPFTVTLKGDNHFPEWNYSKSYEPKAGILEGTDQWQSFLNEVYSWRDYSFGSWVGAWYAVGSKTRNAFGYSTGYRAETYNVTENTMTTVEESILDMDFSIREIKKVHRSIETKDLSSGIVGARYEETREVLEYKSRINKNGDIEYLPAVVEGTRYNFNADNEIESTSDFRSYTIYDDKGREEYALYVETQKDAQGNITGNKIYGYSIAGYDPATGLTPIAYGSNIEMSDIAGDFLRMTRYGDIAWRLLQDKDAYSRISQGAENTLEIIIAVALSVAKLVVDEGYDYEVAKINAISTLLVSNATQDTLTTQGALY